MNKRFKNSDFENAGLIKPSSRTQVLPGTILVASPAIQNTPFARTVVLVLQNSENGIFGVVLNKPGNQQLRSAWLQMTGASDGEQSLVHGGPIGGPVLAIHQDHELAELEIPGGVFVSSKSEAVQELVRQPGLDYRIVFGVAGWNHDQLSRELDSGFWFEIGGSPEVIFDDPDWMWEKSLRTYGKNTLCDVVGLEGLPEDPELN